MYLGNSYLTFYTSSNFFEDSVAKNYDIIENDNDYAIELDVAGINKEDISIEIDKNYLIISGEKKSKDNVKYRFNNFNFGKFENKFKLPENINSDNIKAKHENGILLITVPKSEKKNKKSIKIE